MRFCYVYVQATVILWSPLLHGRHLIKRCIKCKATHNTTIFITFTTASRSLLSLGFRKSSIVKELTLTWRVIRKKLSDALVYVWVLLYFNLYSFFGIIFWICCLLGCLCAIIACYNGYPLGLFMTIMMMIITATTTFLGRKQGKVGTYIIIINIIIIITNNNHLRSTVIILIRTRVQVMAS